MSAQDQVLEKPAGLNNSVFHVLSQFRKPIVVVLAFALGCVIWYVEPSASIGGKGLHFLATLSVGVTLWIFEVFDDYIVALMLLLSWVVLDIVPSKVALSGFSQGSWFFVVGVLGIGAAVNKTGLLYRLAVHGLSRIPNTSFKIHTLVLLVSGLLTTPLLPTGKARTASALPVSQAFVQASGFKHRSNGSAALSLAALVGFSQMSFMFLTGGAFGLIGWNLLPEQSKSEFGWMVWFVSALPAGIFIFLFVFAAIHYLFPLKTEERARGSDKAMQLQLEKLGPVSNAQWVGLSILVLILAAWLTKPFHGIGEAWIALSGLLFFLTTGSLDKKSLRNDLDWGLILFFGIVNSIAVISIYLKVDLWFMNIVAPILARFSYGPLGFLEAVVLIVYFTRLFLRKSPAVMVLTLTLVPFGMNIGIHPGIVLLTISTATECFILPYQDGPYQIAYSSTNGQAFSHVQARKILVARFIGTIAAIALSVPYWKMLGFIH
ncbi:SLC13 family permease [Thermodesulfobacteriota bacterium]